MAIKVGKNILESLTQGMYTNSRVIFREYIQNAADSIDRAVEDGLITKEKGKIDVFIGSKSRVIRIRDNGTGISSAKVNNALGDIGNSEKDFKEDKGFRGIGRLGGLSYCEKLEFITSHKGESNKSRTIWDCTQLRKLLAPNSPNDFDLLQVVEAVTERSDEPEHADKHYFEVKLIGITDESKELLDVDDIAEYLGQVAPVPYDCKGFTYLSKINHKLIELNQKIFEYQIFVNDDPIYKPYSRRVLAGKKEKDYIEDIVFFEGKKDTGDLFFVGWYGIAKLSGMIKDNKVSGIRVRKHNILIGSKNTLDDFFIEGRFNRYFIGEIFVFEDQLIPNARRDDFEKNPTYHGFKREVEKITKEILSKLVRDAQKSRTNHTKIEAFEKKIEDISKNSLNTGHITNTRKEKILSEVENIKKGLKTIHLKRQPNDMAKESDIWNFKKKDIEIRARKDTLSKELEKVKKAFVSPNAKKERIVSSSYSKEVDKVIRIVFEVIDRVLPDEKLAAELQKKIRERLREKPKKNRSSKKS